MMQGAVMLTLAAALFLCAGLLQLGRRKAGYSHLRHTISEIGETGSGTARMAAYGLFLPVGLMLLAVAWMVRAIAADAALLALCIALGYLGAAAFPCDPGSPASGSARQGMHNLFGAIEYLGGALALMKLAGSAGQPFRLAAFLVFGAAIALTVLPSGGVRGLIQRVAESTLFGALALALAGAVRIA